MGVLRAPETLAWSTQYEYGEARKPHLCLCSPTTGPMAHRDIITIFSVGPSSCNSAAATALAPAAAGEAGRSSQATGCNAVVSTPPKRPAARKARSSPRPRGRSANHWVPCSCSEAAGLVAEAVESFVCEARGDPLGWFESFSRQELQNGAAPATGKSKRKQKAAISPTPTASGGTDGVVAVAAVDAASRVRLAVSSSAPGVS